MGVFLIRRIFHGLLVVLGTYTLTFILLTIVPGDPVRLMLAQGGENMVFDEARIAELRSEYGFDRPVIVQFLDGLWKLVQGDFGRSVQTGRDVGSVIMDALPSTLVLGAGGMTIGIILGSLIAIVATYVRTPTLRNFLLSIPPFLGALPSFWIGLMLLQLLSFTFPIFPAFGGNDLRSLVLPSLTLGILVSAGIGQVFARSILETLPQPFVATAVGKGAGQARVHLRHVVRNAMLPAVTYVGIVTGHILAGSVIVETVFSRAGIGHLMVTAVGSKDFAVVQGIVVLMAAVFAAVTLIVDVSYRFLDPRLSTPQS